MKYIILLIIISNVYFYLDIVFSFNITLWFSRFLKFPKVKSFIKNFSSYILSKLKSFDIISFLKKLLKKF